MKQSAHVIATGRVRAAEPGFPWRALRGRLRDEGALQLGQITCRGCVIGDYLMNDEPAPRTVAPPPVPSRRDLLLGVGGAGLLAAGLVASSPRAAAAQNTDSLTTQDISLSQSQAIVEAAIAAST